MSTKHFLGIPEHPLLQGALTLEEAGVYAHVFKTLGDPARLKILSTIAAAHEKALTVSELTSRVELAQSTISHHLKKLTAAGLLERHQSGREVRHTINSEAFTRLCALLSGA